MAEMVRASSTRGDATTHLFGGLLPAIFFAAQFSGVFVRFPRLRQALSAAGN